MSIYDRHLLREWLQVLALVLAAMIGLLLVQVLYDDFRMLSDLGAGVADFGLYVLVTLPGFLAIVLPVALLLSLLYALGRLHRAGELVALRAAGVGLWRITVPVWLVGLLMCAVTGVLNASVVPWSVETSRALRDSLEFRHRAESQPEDAIGAQRRIGFDNRTAGREGAGGRLWFINRYSQFTQRAYGVTVSVFDTGEAREVRGADAASGAAANAGAGVAGGRREARRIVAAQAWPDPARGGWVFANGQELFFNPETGEIREPRPFAEHFEAGYDEEPALMLTVDRRPADLSFFELRRLVDYYAAEGAGAKGAAYAVRYFGLVADTLGPLIVIALAIPFAASGVRVNPAVGVSKSIGLFFLYYVLMNLASSLAVKQVLDPALAAWLPNAGMTGIAACLFVRLR
ncbi:LptF/LptG family permease [Cephaloticoccus primus]|uniref:LptF/LptG family permease n=1 Tax=Cephaloticoccus primus TaxID=1548207 RepID=UPI0008390261|nr:LptF/LptG family permease [Cephaloticoccus primus]